MGLSRAGAAQVRVLAAELAGGGAEHILHSGARRTRLLAERIAAAAGVACEARPDWRERDFGAWEGRPWSAIYRETGSAMDGMIDDPAGFRPGGGETTAELGARIAAAVAALPAGWTIVVTHGGPIAAALGQARGVPVRDWPALVPPPGGCVFLDSTNDAGLG